MSSSAGGNRGHQSWWANKKKKKALPDRWEKYVPYGKPIPNSRFIAFKVPLRSTVAVPEKDGSIFTPAAMLDSFAADDIDVGLIVDLTFTQKYYGPEIIEDLFGQRDIAYHKIYTEGHEIPKKCHVDNFQRVVAEFLDQDSKRLVGVHCTHGLNRTGYMVCRYLIERLGWNPEDAIAAFDDARGHRQERQNYLDDLRRLKRGDVKIGKGRHSSHRSSPATNGSTNPPAHSGPVSRCGLGGSNVHQRHDVWARLGPETTDSNDARSRHQLPGSSYPQPHSHRSDPNGPQCFQRPRQNNRPADRPVFQPYHRHNAYRPDDRSGSRGGLNRSGGGAYQGASGNGHNSGNPYNYSKR